MKLTYLELIHTRADISNRYRILTILTGQLFYHICIKLTKNIKLISLNLINTHVQTSQTAIESSHF